MVPDSACWKVMTTKHVFESSDGLVLKSLRGAVALNPSLRLHKGSKSVYVCDRSPSSRVAVISGGGSGHEPAHAGYTGRGMLTASVSGDIFASPSASQVFTAIQLAVASCKVAEHSDKKEVLLIINNYTGDRLNFGLGAERASTLLGAHVESVIVADDVSLLDQDPPSLVGPRGLGANILVCKLLGAAAESGLTLGELKCLGDAVVDSLGSIGVGLGHCHVPGRPKGDDGNLKDGECELGLGLHNEPGARRMQIGNADDLVRAMLKQILDCGAKRSRLHISERGAVKPDSEFVHPGDDVVLYLNNLGGISQLEMGAMADEVLSQLASLEIFPTRVYSHAFMTSLNAPGFSISILNTSAIYRRLSENSDGTFSATVPQILSYLDAPAASSAWVGIHSWPSFKIGAHRDRNVEEGETESLLQSLSADQSGDDKFRSAVDHRKTWEALNLEPSQVEKGLRSACEAVFMAESELTQFDTVMGDGDCGTTFASGARAVIAALDNQQIGVRDMSPSLLVRKLSEVLEDSMGGTSGALFGLFFTALSRELADGDSLSSASAPLRALNALAKHTPARPGDRTLVDALAPFCNALARAEGFRKAVAAAMQGAEGTRYMKPRLGRSTYVPMDNEGVEGGKGSVPDPGAWGVAAILSGLERGISDAIE